MSVTRIIIQQPPIPHPFPHLTHPWQPYSAEAGAANTIEAASLVVTILTLVASIFFGAVPECGQGMSSVSFASSSVQLASPIASVKTLPS